MTHHPNNEKDAPCKQEACEYCNDTGWILAPSRFEDGEPCPHCNPDGAKRTE